MAKPWGFGKSVILVGGVICFASGLLFGDDVGTESDVVTVLVVKDSASIMAQDEVIAKAPLGAVADFTRTSGPWRYLPRFGGWVHEKDTIELQLAVAHYSEVIRKRPDPTAYHLRGIALMANENWGPALLDLEKAYDLGEGSISLHLNLGTCYRELNDHPAALQEFTNILQAHPETLAALLGRGEILADQGHWDAARRDFEYAVQVAPKSAEAQNQYGVSLRMLERYDEAAAAYTTALEIDSEFAEAAANRAFIRKRLGLFADAIADYEQALTLDGDSAAIHNDFAWCLATCPEAEFRDPERALMLARKATTDDPENADFLDTLAAAQAAKGDFDNAVNTAMKALLASSDPTRKRDIHARVEQYRSGRPYVEPVPQPEN